MGGDEGFTLYSGGACVFYGRRGVLKRTQGVVGLIFQDTLCGFSPDGGGQHALKDMSRPATEWVSAPTEI